MDENNKKNNNVSKDFIGAYALVSNIKKSRKP